MSQPITITATLPAWLPPWEPATTFLDIVKDGKHQDAIDKLHFTALGMSSGDKPWTRVGDAEITVTLAPKDDIVAAQVKALEAELQNARAEWMTKQQAILDRISRLQALDYTQEVAE